MAFLARLLGVAIGVFGLLGVLGVAMDKPEVRSYPVAIFCALIIVAGAAVVWWGQRRAVRDARVEVSRKLLALAQKSGKLTVAQVVASLSLTSEEATAALTQLSRDGLAQFDVDEQGATIYRVQVGLLR